MDEEQKKQIAVFRFGVIADFVTGARMARGDKRRLIAEKSARRWRIPFSDRTHIGATTIRDWIARYEAGGCRLEALYPRERCDNGRMRRIDDETAANLLCLRQQMPSAAVGRLIETLHQRFLASAGTHLAPTTVWRFLNRHGLMPSARASAVDRCKFEAELPNDIWQSDVMHGPKVMVEGRRRKAYEVAVIQTILRHKSPSTTERYLKNLGLEKRARCALEELSGRRGQVLEFKPYIQKFAVPSLPK